MSPPLQTPLGTPSERRRHYWRPCHPPRPTHGSTPKALQRGLQRAVSLAQRGGQRIASRFLRVLTEPFAVGNLDETRRATALRLIRIPGMESLCAEAFSTVEPFVYAHEGVLAARVACYARTDDPRRAQAERDLARIGRWSARGADGTR